MTCMENMLWSEVITYGTLFSALVKKATEDVSDYVCRTDNDSSVFKTMSNYVGGCSWICS
jgi:hypothetical protein